MNGRFKDFTQDLAKAGVWTWEKGVVIAALWDIRDELKALNNLLTCQNFLSVPHSLRKIADNTTKREYKRKSKVTK